MRINTRFVFKTLLRLCQADCVCDIGSCDGRDSLKFRQILPRATLLAFEANPLLYERMAANEGLRNNRVEMFPYAVSNANGTACFHVTDTDYDDPNEPNTGTSSLLVHRGLKTKDTVQVKTCRMDELIPSKYPQVQRIGLWIDAEGAEYGVLEGIAGIKARVAAVHVETAWTPMREGQKVYPELESLMKSYGFTPLGNGLRKGDIWGDVVFVNDKLAADLGLKFRCWRCITLALSWTKVDEIPSVLVRRCQPLYRFLWSVYSKMSK
jgi:FkbM family methyltransferase